MKILSLLSSLLFCQVVSAHPADYEIPWDAKTGEITDRCPKEISGFEAQVEEWVKKTQADKDTTSFDYFLEYEDLGFSLESFYYTNALIFNLHTEEKIRKETHLCKMKIINALDKVSSRRDIYQTLKKLKPRNKKEERLSYVVLKGLEKNGTLITDEKKYQQFLQNQEKQNEYSSEFGKNINDDKSFVTFTVEELDGLSENSIKRFEKMSDGRLKVTMKETDYSEVMNNAHLEATRKAVYTAYRKRVGQKNIDLLNKILELRQSDAELLGYKNWAEVQTSGRMAQNPETVFKFYDSLRPTFFAYRDKNLERLKKFKGEEVHPWDVEYYSRLYKKKYKDFDEEKTREYFPTKKVVAEMLRFYQELFSVQFKEINNKNVWHPTVRTFEIIDNKKTIAYFYLDLEPREGKYSHQAAMNYRPGFKQKDGSYRRPISVMMGNMTPEKPDAPSLLTFREVETLFHEFGHVMHGTLTKAPYRSLAGTNVYRDFVEAPSQMLENWIYTDTLLNRISSHYKTGKKIPADLVRKIKENKNYNSGMFFSRQMMLGMYDMTLHTQKVDDPVALFLKLAKEYSSLEPLPEDMTPAGFGHLMGYSAGYYGYMWSEVYAQDMFSKFQEKGIMNKTLGMKYRQVILEQGNMMEPMELLKIFLGREPSTAAFLKSIKENY